MGDLNTRHWLVSPTKEIDEDWMEVQIQEKVSQIARKQIDIEDLMKGAVKKAQTEMKMLELEKIKLENDLLRSRSMPAEVEKEEEEENK